MLKLYERGEPNKVLHEIIRRNVRTPNEVFGDLAAQVSSGKLAAKRLSALLDRQAYDDIETLSDEIIARSEVATRESIRKLKPGTYHGESQFDVPGGDIIVLKTAVTVDAGQGRDHHRLRGLVGPEPLRHQCGDELHPRLLDLRDPLLPQSGTAEQFRQPRADQGRGAGRLHRELQISGACERAPRRWHVRVNAGAQGALSRAFRSACLPKARARCGRSRSRARTRNGEPFTSSMFNYSGGMGARKTKPGPSATCYPTGVAAVPVEVLEAAMPIVFEKKELREGSGGAGKSRGGDGQTIAWHMRTNSPVAAQCGAEPHVARAGRLGRRRAGRGGQISRQRQVSERSA